MQSQRWRDVCVDLSPTDNSICVKISGCLTKICLLYVDLYSIVRTTHTLNPYAYYARRLLRLSTPGVVFLSLKIEFELTNARVTIICTKWGTMKMIQKIGTIPTQRDTYWNLDRKEYDSASQNLCFIFQVSMKDTKTT